ncbi:MAG: XRE family transcriptional regulator [bacterium]|nr:XRE family transcriptional regulator [bacterium]
MNNYTFILILNRPVDEATSDLLFEAGLDDAAVTGFDGCAALEVDREAPSLLDAIASAVREAESVNGVEVVRVEGEELVSQADIAERTGRSRQAVNHWVKRDGGSRGFPIPAYGASTRSPLWRWADVQAWLNPDGPADDRDRIIALANATLLARHNLHDDDERRLVGDLLAAS